MILALSLHQILAQDTVPPSSLGDLVPASSCSDRSISSIVWSCLTTIFACTWIAIHPNIPRSSERPILRRLKIFAMALVAPELIVLWALRQWLSSRKLAHKYKEFGWTQTHGFFVIMGGFHVGELGGVPLVLDSEDLGPYLQNRDIDISEKDIQDRSKGDVLSKCLVMLQVTWFVLQVLARAAQHLAITELEIVTLAFAVLNFMTYFCWWNKPLDVNCSIRVTAYHPSQRSDGFNATVTTTVAPIIFAHGTLGGARGGSGTLTLDDLTLDDLENHASAAPASSPYPDPLLGVTHDENTEVTSHRLNSDDASPPQTVSDIPVPDKAILAAERTSFRPEHHYSYDSNGEETYFVPVLRPKPWSTFVKSALTQIAGFVRQAWLLCPYILALTARTLISGIDLTSREFAKLAIRGHYPARRSEYSFGTLNQSENMLTDSLSCGVAVIFGVIHCLAWHFDFPTKPEALLWRTSSIIITCLPTYALILPRLHSAILSISKNTLRLLLFKLHISYWRMGKVVYISARLLLLVQMLVLLREPGKGVYTSINWITYIPHF
ncbi:hypothetical protein DXG01_002848 [Tephrocybe rancida]|nr:hypothetical protein DXG01_002848 [Tephrocybe rancida]